MQSFLVCIHDVTPAFALEIRRMIRDLTPLIGRRICCGVVPDWHGHWPLAGHPDFCGLIGAASEELLLHGYFHQRERGCGPVTLLTAGSDEMNGLDPDETRRTLERGQRVLAELFGHRARGFLAPGWQAGHVRAASATSPGLEHVLGYFSLEGPARRHIPLATWTWDCGRWGWLGHLGHGFGGLRHASSRGVPALAIHPGDLEHGFWPKILDLTRALLDSGYEPSTPARLIEATC